MLEEVDVSGKGTYRPSEDSVYIQLSQYNRIERTGKVDTVVTEGELNSVLYDEAVEKIKQAVVLLDSAANDLDVAERWDTASRIDELSMKLASIRNMIQNWKV